jgi:CarD family transcriptional regulator
MFCKGDMVVYPQHGAAIVEDLVELQKFGKNLTYIKLCFPHELTLMIPVGSAEQVGLRAVVTRDQANKVFDLLAEDASAMPVLWNQRYKANLAKVVSGDVYEVAEVVRNLSLRKRTKDLSNAETRMLAKAREILLSELVFVIDATDESAEDRVDRVLERT